MVAATTNNNTHSDINNEKINKATKQSSSCHKDLLIRTSWTDAAVALAQIEKVNFRDFLKNLAQRKEDGS